MIFAANALRSDQNFDNKLTVTEAEEGEVTPEHALAKNLEVMMDAARTDNAMRSCPLYGQTNSVTQQSLPVLGLAQGKHEQGVDDYQGGDKHEHHSNKQESVMAKKKENSRSVEISSGNDQTCTLKFKW